MIWDADATVKGEALFEGAEPSLCAISRGRIAVLAQSPDGLSERSLWVYDKQGKSVYSLTLDENHPISRSGETLEMVFGGEVLYIRTADRLFRLSGNGEEITSRAISHDTLTMLPTDVQGNEVLVCTPAYAARLDREDFTGE